MFLLKTFRTKTPFFKTITQGGQVHLHQLRMLKQVFIAGLIFSLIMGVGCFMWKCYTLPHGNWETARDVYWAKLLLATSPEENHKSLSQLYKPPKGRPYQRNCVNILQDPILKRKTQWLEVVIKYAGYQSLKFGGLCFLSVMVLWFLLGRSQGRSQHQRGNRIVPWKQLAKLLKKQEKDSDLKIGKLPLVKDKETSHTLITGTTGSGKTNNFHILLPQIWQRGDRALIIDVTGDYVARYYDEERDIILNPLDIRSVSWHPWADCHLKSHYDVFAESLIQPKEGSKDPFWDNASRILFKTALQKYAAQGNYDIRQLINFLSMASEGEFEDFFQDTEAATFASKSNEKTTNSIRSVLSSQITCLKQLDASEKSFSIRDWVMDEKHPSRTGKSNGWLFVTARPDQRQTLIPLLSAWMDIAINALMISSPEEETNGTKASKRRLWFVIDELAALQKLSRLPTGLAEARKYGGCFLVGFQSKPQLEDIYGRNMADSMLDLFNTKLFFRCTEPSTQQWISKVLGDKEETEPTENISYGAHSMRDGVSLSHHTRQTPLILPAEFSQLNELECYVKLPGDYPCTKLQTRYQKAPSSRKESFILKTEKAYAKTCLSKDAPSEKEPGFQEEDNPGRKVNN